MIKEQALAKADELDPPLSARERFALNSVLSVVKSDDKFVHEIPLAPETLVRMFEMFLQGHSCEQIQRHNPLYSLGKIVLARIENDWDKQRKEYQKELLERTRIRAIQSTFEATDFIADLLTVANVEFGEKLRCYMMTRDPADLGALKIESIKDYKEAVAMFQALTGQDNNKRVTGEVTVVNKSEPQGVDAQSAAAVLKQLLSNRGDIK